MTELTDQQLTLDQLEDDLEDIELGDAFGDDDSTVDSEPERAWKAAGSPIPVPYNVIPF